MNTGLIRIEDYLDFKENEDSLSSIHNLIGISGKNDQTSEYSYQIGRNGVLRFFYFLATFPE